MPRKIQPLTSELSGIFQQYRCAQDICRVAPSPALQVKIQNTLAQMDLKPPTEEDLTTTTTKGGAKKGARKGARKAAGKRGGQVQELINSMLRLRQRAPVGMNDGLIIPGNEFPLGTPLRVVRSAALERAPLHGTVRVIVVLVQFTGTPMTKTKKHFENLFFSTGKIATGSVKEYYKEVSNGAIDIAGEVVGPFTLGHSMSFYANGDSGTGTVEPNARTMAREAAVAANPTVNFAPYDNDGNGYVDAYIVVHAGPGAEETGNVNHIWSHKWVLAGGALNADGTKIYGYLTVPEDARLGVCAHELGHLLFGWIDLYDTDSSSEGIGNWCLMAGGSWNGSGDTPAHPSAWCKVNQGWATVINQTANQTVNIADVKTSKKVYRLWKNGAPGSEYFLVENRQKKLFDKKLPGSGLLVWHVDETISSNSNESHPKIALMQADGLKQLEAAANRGDAGDPFPGSANKTVFNKTSNPSSQSYAGADTCVAITNIGASGAVISAQLNVVCPSLAKSLIKEQIMDKSAAHEKAMVADKHAEKYPDKSPVEKPIIDKSAGFDKNPIEGKVPPEKHPDKPPEGGPGGPGARSGYAGQGSAEPFIGADLRPDLSTGALASEEDYPAAGGQMPLGSPQAKRMFDTKPREF